MALPTSGAISLNQMHVEAGGSSGTIASINDADIRALIGKGSGVTMSFNEWYGASSALDTQTVTVGYQAAQQYLNSGYGSFTTGLGTNVNRNVGSISDGTFNPKSNMYIRGLWYSTSGSSLVVFALRSLNTTVANSGWTTMNVAGVNFTRSSATFSNSNNATSGQTQWSWTTSSNPFGTTVGATKVVTFT